MGVLTPDPSLRELGGSKRKKQMRVHGGQSI